jgi:hypothetical protein
MHAEPPGVDAEGMGGSGSDIDYGPDTRYCRCGCGVRAWRNKYRRYYNFLPGHKRPRTDEQKAAKLVKIRAQYDALCAEERYCECGCGGRLSIVGGTFEAYLRMRKGYYARYLPLHQNRPKNWQLVLTESERSAILGTLIGDGSLVWPHGTSESPRLAFNHSVKQREWVDHKVSVLSRLDFTVREFSNEAGYGGPIIGSASSCLPCLVPLYDMCYRDGKKCVTEQWLDALGPIGMAWWIGDDGSCAVSGMQLHTEGFHPDQVELIAEWIGKKYGSCRVNLAKKKDGRQYRTIYMRAESKRAIYHAVRDFVPKCMEYKLAACVKSIKCGRRPHLRHRS